MKSYFSPEFMDAYDACIDACRNFKSLCERYNDMCSLNEHGDQCQHLCHDSVQASKNCIKAINAYIIQAQEHIKTCQDETNKSICQNSIDACQRCIEVCQDYIDRCKKGSSKMCIRKSSACITSCHECIDALQECFLDT
jgi:hypothetical protein